MAYFSFHFDVQVLTSFEGELEGQDDLLALVSGSGYDMFDWSAGANIGSTFHPQVRMHAVQYPPAQTVFWRWCLDERGKAPRVVNPMAMGWWENIFLWG